MLMARGPGQQKGVGCKEAFIPVVRYKLIIMFLAIAGEKRCMLTKLKSYPRAPGEINYPMKCIRDPEN